jgi:thiol-disulfide isomerase/thioredoxin
MATDPSTPSSYPAGPYGYVTGSTVDNYSFLGKLPPTSGGGYKTEMMQKIDLASVRADPSVKVILIEGSALWCHFCNAEAPTVKALEQKYASQGFRVVEVMAESSQPGLPATEADLNVWAQRYGLSDYTMVIDPSNTIGQYADVSAFPLHLLVTSKDMKLSWMYVGGDAPLEDSLVKILAQ